MTNHNDIIIIIIMTDRMNLTWMFSTSWNITKM